MERRWSLENQAGQGDKLDSGTVRVTFTVTRRSRRFFGVRMGFADGKGLAVNGLRFIVSVNIVKRFGQLAHRYKCIWMLRAKDAATDFQSSSIERFCFSGLAPHMQNDA